MQYPISGIRTRDALEHSAVVYRFSEYTLGVRLKLFDHSDLVAHILVEHVQTLAYMVYLARYRPRRRETDP